MLESDKTDTENNSAMVTSGRKNKFQFRVTSILWLIFSFATFVAGMQFQKHMVSTEFTSSSPIAIVGEFDLDGDGIDDASKLLQMIMRNGGTVCAYDRGNGVSYGRIDHETIVVVGNIPDLSVQIPILEDAERFVNNRKSIRELISQLGLVGSSTPKRNIHDITPLPR